jgi:hypothetical protein
MGGWCDVGPVAIVQTEILRGILVQCVSEFTRHAKRRLGGGAESTFMAIFDRTIGSGLTAGEQWTRSSRAFVLHYVAQWGREAERLATTLGEREITPSTLEEAAQIVIDRGRRVEQRLSA